MTEWISIIINILLLVITLGTVVFANKTLLMEHSSQVTVSRIKISSNINKHYPFSWEVELENVGKGYVVKAFILLSMTSKDSKWKKCYFLSKPIVGLKPNEHRKMKLTLREEHIKKTNQDYRTTKVEILYQDAMNNVYIVSPDLLIGKKVNLQLESFDRLPRKMNKLWINYWLYKMKINKAIKQGNSYPARINYEIETKRNQLEKKFKNFKFERINNKDAN